MGVPDHWGSTPRSTAVATVAGRGAKEVGEVVELGADASDPEPIGLSDGGDDLVPSKVKVFELSLDLGQVDRPGRLAVVGQPAHRHQHVALASITDRERRDA